MALTQEALSWDRDGYFVVRSVLSKQECDQLLDVSHALVTGGRDDVVVRLEDNLSSELPLEQRVSKLYRLHRHAPFRMLCTDSRLLDYVRPLIGTDGDIFLSQVVWKLPGALGQPWHQDSSIFPFDPPRPVIGTWLALTSAHETNGCLHVAPGSHRQPVLDHGFDPESQTGGRYLSLKDQQVEHRVALRVEPGDLVVFDSHLLHTSMDNVSKIPRVALTFHYASAGTTDRTIEQFGASPYNDWMPAWRESRESNAQD